MGILGVIVVAGVVVQRIRGRTRPIGGRADAKEGGVAAGVRIDSHCPAPALTLYKQIKIQENNYLRFRGHRFRKR